MTRTVPRGAPAQAYRRRASASLRQKSAFLLGDRIWIITQQLALMHTPAHAHSRAHTGVERPRLAFGRSKPDHTGILSAADQAHATGDLCYRPTALGPNPDPETTCARPSARAHPRTRVLRPRQLRHPSRYHAPLLRVCRVEPPLVAVIRHPYPSPLLSFP
jgi:hypothetical protein